MKYRKQNDVDAFQLTYGVAVGKESIPSWAKDLGKEDRLRIQVTNKIEDSQKALLVEYEGENISGFTNVDANDWIVLDNGELKAYSDKDFKNEYRAVQ